MADEHVTVPQNLVKHWGVVLEDMASTAAEYREEGWETYELHPGHVAVIPESADRSGFEVLVPDNEFDPIAGMDSAVDEFKVLREELEGMGYRLVIAEDQHAEVAVFVPIYYEFPAVDELREAAEDAGFVHVHVRALSKEKGVVSFELDDPGLLFPSD